jgi:hypothetical protein
MFNGLQQNPRLSTPQFRQFAHPLQQIGRVLEGENAIYAPPGQGLPKSLSSRHRQRESTERPSSTGS